MFRIILALCSCFLSQPSFAEQPVQPGQEYKVVFHIDAGGDALYEKLIGHLENVLQDSRVRGRVKVAVMANSKGAYLLTHHEKLADKLAELHDKGIQFKICKNTMKKFGIKPEDVDGHVEMVESAVGELIVLQARGYGYIQPTAP